jgi:hypothetical protein
MVLGRRYSVIVLGILTELLTALMMQVAARRLFASSSSKDVVDDDFGWCGFME